MYGEMKTPNSSRGTNAMQSKCGDREIPDLEALGTGLMTETHSELL